MKRSKTSGRMIVILAIVFVVFAAALAYQSTQHEAMTPTPEVTYLNVFTDFTTTDIQAIRLRSPENGATFSMVHADDGSWTLPDGSGTVNPNDADGLLRTMVLMPYSRTLPLSSGADLTSYGFTPEGILAIEIILNDGTTHAVAVGYRTPTEDSYYGLIDNRTDLYLLERPPIDYLISRLKNPPIT